MPRLQVYGYALAAIYAVLLTGYYCNGLWLVDRAGLPLYTDFTTFWLAALHAAHGHAAQLYDRNEFLIIQAALLPTIDAPYPNFPYPPTFLLIVAPLAALPYPAAFLLWTIVTLSGLLLVICRIVRRHAAVAVVLASPYTAWNFLAGQNGCLTASLLGAALLLLQRRPVLAGTFFGCLSYKPQFGLLVPFALAAAGEWRALAGATTATVLFAAASWLAFGAAPWAAFPHALLEQFGVVLQDCQSNDAANWGALQTVYGLLRSLHSGAAIGWIAQTATATSAVVIVWLVWRSNTRHDLKAATLSAAMFLATPYAFAYDLAGVAIPVAFLARDQLRNGLLWGEQSTTFALFALVLAALISLRAPPNGLDFGSLPLGPFVTLVLLGLILRRYAMPPRGSDHMDRPRLG